MLCDRCALERGLAEGEAGNCSPVGIVDGVAAGYFGSPWFRVSGDVVLAGHAASRAVA